MRKLLSAGLLSVLLTTLFSFPAYAEDEEGEEDKVDDISDEVESALDDLEEVIFEEAEDSDDEGEVKVEGGEITVEEEEVADEDLSIEVVEEFDAAAESGDYPDKLYLSVQWGYFPAEGEDATEMGAVTWNGDISFENSNGLVKARPFKLIGFEKNQDGLDSEDATSTNASFISEIFGHHDGILFKVRTDLSSDTQIVFETEYSITAAEVSLSDLVAAGEMEFDYSPYKVVMKAWSHDDWLEGQSEHRDPESLEPEDVEQGSWYERYMDDSVDNGFFQGYKDEKGKLTGNIGPNDPLTRFQLLKVLFELANKLDMGVGATDCDPNTVSTTSSTDWMEGDWARGYVQCVEDSGLNVTMLDEVIDGDLVTGNQAALRWEVIATAFELLDIDTSGTEDTTLDDVSDSGLRGAFMDMIDKGVELGILSGYPDGSFKPFRQVNRAEMFKITSLFYEVLSL
ncbi:MAG: S-layer homology domain-containing protein [Candidatus Gracilibacteria bacterium]